MSNILFVTGTRADFSKMKSLIQRVEDSDFECSLFVTGMHTLARHGYTVDEVYKTIGEHRLSEGFRSVYTFMNNADTMEQTLANTIDGLSRYVREFKPDMIVVHGDRVEALAGAIVGALRNILVAHIEGGEVSGSVDEIMRHAITKLSHIHFVANREAANRLRQMGEGSVHIIGSPDIDLMLGELPTLEEVKTHYGIKWNTYGVALFHPPGDVRPMVESLRTNGHNYVVVYPNNDEGCEDIFKVYERLNNNPKFAVFPSMRTEYFLTLLKNSMCVVGNSSVGVREAPIYGVQSINIGDRQRNRFEYESIKNVENNQVAIMSALDNIGTYKPSYHFGKGNSADLFMEALETEELWQTPTQKQFIDL